MKAEIISIGTELLLGSTLNSNACFLSRRLSERAVDVYHHSTVGDNIPRILECLETAALRSHLIITTGGLGPTEDDVTNEALASFLSRPLRLDRGAYRSLVRRLRLRGRRKTRLIERQCRVPAGCRVFPNREGTAPGTLTPFFYNNEKRWLLALPGPPRELEPMFVRQALPLFLKLSGMKAESFVVRSVKLTGLIEADAAPKVTDLLRRKPPLTVGIYARPDEVDLKIMAKASRPAQARRMAASVERVLRKRFGRRIFGTDEETLASAVVGLLRKKKMKLSVAESCTGGLVSSLLTQVPGSSDVFLGGIISYSNASKEAHLGIPARLLKAKGAVSADTARRMAQGVLERFRSDAGVAVTGIAGPSGGSAQKPVGLVFIAIARRGRRTRSVRCRFSGDRAKIRMHAANRALDLLRLGI